MADADVIEDLRRRVEALEKAHNTNTGTLKWISGTLGQVAADVAGLREDTTKRFDKIDADISGLRREFNDFQRSFAGEVAETMREVLKETR